MLEVILRDYMKLESFMQMRAEYLESPHHYGYFQEICQ